MTVSGERIRAAMALVLTAVFLSGCGVLGTPRGQAPDGRPLETFTAQQIFERGEFELARGRPGEAAFYFAEIERLYPYSELAKRALIMQAYAWQKSKDYDSARAAAQRYIDFYPADEDAAYAQYLLALSYYNLIDEVGRDQSVIFNALQELRKVIELYPESDYARSAILKFDVAFDFLAAKEMEVGRYYLKRRIYGAAINRFRNVVENFQTTTQTPEALYRLVEAYLALGLDQEAQTAAAILGHNFRGTEWYRDAYRLLKGKGLSPGAKGNSWLSKIYRQTIRGQWL